MDKVPIIKKFELTNAEKDLVNAIRDYMRGSEPGIEYCGHRLLGELMRHILDKHGYEDTDFGEVVDFDRDSWESIMVYYNEDLEEHTKEALKLICHPESIIIEELRGEWE